MSTAKKINPLSLKASDIRLAMKNRWTEPEWAIMWEVNQGTGMNGGRSADAVMMSLWPSRGLELHGVEIKVSRSDWKRESADPSKAEAVAQYCDRWWIHTPQGVIDDLSDVPPQWGLREWTGKQWKTLREAEKREDVPDPPRSFLAALLRRADGMMAAMVREATREAREASYNEGERLRALHRQNVKAEVDRRTSALRQQVEQFQVLEDAFGAKISDWSIDPAVLGRAARALHDTHKAGWKGLPSAERLRVAANEIEALEAVMKPATPSTAE